VIICNHDNSHLNDRQTVIECIVVCELTNRKNANCVATLFRKNTSLALIDLAVNTLHEIVYQWHLLWIRVIGVLRSHVWIAFFISKWESVITKGAPQGCTDSVLCPVLCIQRGQCWRTCMLVWLAFATFLKISWTVWHGVVCNSG